MANVQDQHQHQHHHITHWTGWIGFASILMLLTAGAHLLFGFAGVFTNDWYLYTSNNAYIFDSSSWGWSLIGGALLLILSAMLLLRGNMFGRVVGVLVALSSLLVNIGLFPAAPIWSGLVIAMDVLIIYAIVAHGKEMKYLDEDL